jgi:hypothetical protein
VPITTDVANWNPTQAKCTRYNIMWESLSDLRQVDGFFQVSSTNKTDCHDITEILLKVTLNTINLTLPYQYIIPPLIEWGLYCNHLVRLSVRSHFRNRYLSFYWKKWFYIWYMALAWWLVPCLPFPGLPHIYFLFTVRLTNEWVGVFLARRSMQHLVVFSSGVKS